MRNLVDHTTIVIDDTKRDKSRSDEIYKIFSQALLSTLYRTYANYIEHHGNENDFQAIANYFLFFKKAISNDPEL